MLQWFYTAKSAVLRIRDVYPGSRILIFTHPGSRISDPGCRIQKQQWKSFGEKKFVVIPFFWSQRPGIRDPGSGIWKKPFLTYLILYLEIRYRYFFSIIEYNLFRIPDPGVKKAPDPGSGSATLKKCISRGYCEFTLAYNVSCLFLSFLLITSV